MATLALALPRAAPRDAAFVTQLLARVPAHAARHLSAPPPDERARRVVVRVDGADLALDVVLAALRREPSPADGQLAFLQACVAPLLRALPFSDAVAHPLAHQLTEYLAQRAPARLADARAALAGPPLYAALVLQQRAGVPAAGAVAALADVADLVRQFAVSHGDHSVSGALLAVLAAAVPRVPTGPLLLRASTVLIRMAQSDTAAVLAVLDAHVLARAFAGEDDVAAELHRHFRPLLTVPQKALSRLMQWARVPAGAADDARRALVREALVALQQTQQSPAALRLAALFDRRSTTSRTRSRSSRASSKCSQCCSCRCSRARAATQRRSSAAAIPRSRRSSPRASRSSSPQLSSCPFA